MGAIHSKVGIKQQVIRRTIIRADGAVEELGVIAYYHQNPIRRWWGQWHYSVGRMGAIRKWLGKFNTGG